MARQKRKPPHAKQVVTRRYRNRGVEVEIREAKDRVELKLDGKPIAVSLIDGKFHSQIAHAFRTFDSLDEVVDTLLANQGRTWTLHGHVCDERCSAGGHHDHGPGHTHDHEHGSHPHGAGGQP